MMRGRRASELRDVKEKFRVNCERMLEEERVMMDGLGCCLAISVEEHTSEGV
jgi:hypothetical protein